MKRALSKLRESVDRYREAYEAEQSAAEDYRMLYQEEERKRNRDTRIGVVLLIVLLTALILS
jgi:predicted SAM-dependent methyltransferase